MKILYVIAFVILTSCVSWTAQNRERLNTWIGASESDLISKWGMPNSTYSLGNKKYVAFEESSIHSYQGTVHSFYCKVTFTLSKNEVVEWNYNDDLCFDLIKAR